MNKLTFIFVTSCIFVASVSASSLIFDSLPASTEDITEIIKMAEQNPSVKPSVTAFFSQNRRPTLGELKELKRSVEKSPDQVIQDYLKKNLPS